MRQKPPPAPVPLLALTPAQTCEALQIGRDTFDVWSHRPGFPVIRDGKTILVPLESLKTWLIEQASGTKEDESFARELAQLPIGAQRFRIGSGNTQRPGDFVG